jgi:hypothetical protein
LSDKLNLIKHNLAEVLNPEIIESALAEGCNTQAHLGKPHSFHLLSVDVLLK